MKIFGSNFVVLICLFLLNIFGCESAPKSKDPTLKVPTTMERCIGQGDDHYDVIKRCGLRTWAEIPLTIEHDKRLAVSIGGGAVHELPCKPNSLWIGTLQVDLVAKCNKGRVRLYWKDFFKTGSEEKSKPRNENSIRASFMEVVIIDDSFSVLATVYFADKTREYRIHGRPYSRSEFGPLPDQLETEDRVEKTLNEIDAK